MPNKQDASMNNLIYAHFFFVDIVGLSDPVISVKKQIKKIEALNSLIAACETFKNTASNLMLVLPTGDGMAIGFIQGPELPLRLALELHKRLNNYNKGKFTEEILRVRIGLNDGPVFVVKDILGNQNIWGPGIILARRVMDIGDGGHILVTQRMAETLRELSDEYRTSIHFLTEYTIKHDQRIKLYSVYDKGIGNSAIPSKLKDVNTENAVDIRSKPKLRPTTIYKEIKVILTIRDVEKMLVHYKRIYHIENTAEKPIIEVSHGIATDVARSFQDLKIRTYDETGEIPINYVKIDQPYQKEFTTKFNRPVFKSEDRRYTLEYEVEEPERYFENYFSVNCERYSISFIYPASAKFKPVVYDINVEKETKKKSKTQPVIKKVNAISDIEEGRGKSQLKESMLHATWTKTRILESQAFRIEW